LVEPFRRYWRSTTSPVIDTAAATTAGGTCPCTGSAEKAGASFDKRLIQTIAAEKCSTDQGDGKRRSGHEAMFLLFEEFFVELF